MDKLITEAQFYSETSALFIEQRDLTLKQHDRAYDHLQSDGAFWKAIDFKIAGKKRAIRNRAVKLRAAGFTYDREKRNASLLELDPNWNWKWAW